MRLISVFRALLVLLLLAPATLQAQLNGNLVSKTDLLDVYRGQSARAELLSVYDFSGSMTYVYWHPSYYTNIPQGYHNSPWGNDDPRSNGWQQGLFPCVDQKLQVTMRKGYGTADSGSSSYTGSGVFQGTGYLVRPNGTRIEYLAANATKAVVRATVMQASHVRITAKYTIDSVSVTRTVDLPIPWAIIDWTKGTANATNDVLVVDDPLDGPDVKPDTLFEETSADNVLPGSSSPYKIGRFQYGNDFLWWVFFGKDKATGFDDTPTTNTGKFIIPAVASDKADWEPTDTVDVATNGAWKNTLPGMTRAQALKYAVIKVWMPNQKKVWWAYRTLDTNEKSTPSSDNGSATTTGVSRDIRLFGCATSATQPDEKVKAFTSMVPGGGTPMTIAMSNAYAQLTAADNKSTLGPGSVTSPDDCPKGQSGTEKKIPACRKSFVALFTDGFTIDSPGTGDPWGTLYGTETTFIKSGIAALAANPASAGPGKTNYNIHTLAGISAHYPNSGLGATVLGGYTPFKIVSRGATAADPRRVRTITVAMALGGSVFENGSGKAELFKAALYGNPDDQEWQITDKPYDPDTNPDPSSPYFFDARSPNQLVRALENILALVAEASNSVAAPASPLVGLSLGRQAYLGLFETKSKGPVWKGDLLMAGIKVTASGVSFVDAEGNETQKITSTPGSAVWSANRHLTTQKSWLTRKVVTTLSATDNTIVDLKETNASITSAMLNTTDDKRTAFIRFLRGATPDGEADGSTSTVRPMGDLISSSPAAVEYPLSLLSDSGAPASLATAYAEYSSAKYSDIRFRVIFVSDNHGYLHAFGEVSGTEAMIEDKVVKGYKVHGEVEELWAFIPNELLPVAAYLKGGSNDHRYFFDGSPYVYHLDKPNTSNFEIVGNGVVDGSDVARLIVGMRKGGRSYYAFDIKSPFADPTLAWQLVPDNASRGTVSGATVAQLATLGKMGLSTTVPAITRVRALEADGTTMGSRDLVFLGGGLSTPDIETKWGSKLGRCLVALDVQDGTVIKTWDFLTTAPGDTNATTKPMGCLSSGVVPYEFFPNSRHAQRIYFVDQPTDSTRGSGLWVLGGIATGGTGNPIRVDTSVMADWGLRKVYQAPPGILVSSSPAPFRIDRFPVGRTADPKLIPAAVGVAFGTGDRNDPMDKDIIEPAMATAGDATTAYNRFVMVFDRQDSADLAGNTPTATSVDTNGLTDSNLVDLTAISSPAASDIKLGDTNYFLNKGFGYYLKAYGQIGEVEVVSDPPVVPPITRPTLALSIAKDPLNPEPGDSGRKTYYAKVVSSPIIISGVGFFSTFIGKDAAGACKGSGATVTYRICNIMGPVYRSGQPLADQKAFNTADDVTPTSGATSMTTYCSGIIQTYVNIAGELTALGTTGILQTGQGSSSTGSGEISTTGAEVQGGIGKKGNFGFRPRTWRVIR